MYNHKEIEKKWQVYWEKNKIFKTENTTKKPKYYCLDMFPYPSGAGLHVGHPKGYTANDIIARYKNARGYNVLHPMGWDAFGLPAENYAIKTGIHPKKITKQNINNFRKQIKSLGFSYDWDREVDTTDPKYYKWTQWIFLKMFEHGLAYEQDLPINYCPSCKTGLANEEVLNDFTCERCGEKVEKKKIKQWVLAITKYADRLLDDVDKLDWPEGIKDMQKNWIGRSEGCEFNMKVEDQIEPPILAFPPNGERNKLENINKEIGTISVYTTRIDTVFGMTYVVIAPDHKNVVNFVTKKQKDKCLKYIEQSKQESDQYRQNESREKTGVFTGNYAINPFNNRKIPIWIADYVLGNYGTGAIMAVPAHDSRDFEFAKKYDLEIKQSIAKNFDKKGKKNAPKKEKYTSNKNVVLGIIYNEDKTKILLLKWKKVNRISFVVGGIEKGEQKMDAIKREIREETGYVDLEFLGLSEIIKTIFFHERKDINFDNYETGFVFKLNSNKQEKIEEKELAKHGYNWININEIKNKLTFEEDYYFFEKLIEKGQAFSDYGILVNSGEFSGLSSQEAMEEMTKYAEKEGFGTKKVNYKLRDWLFSRQRYWGEPIPLIHLKNEDVEKLEKIDDKKSENSYSKKGGGHSKGNTAKFSLCTVSIIEKVKKVKKKNNKKVFQKIYKEFYTNKGFIIFNGQKLINHFITKSTKEQNFRKRFGETILKYVNDIIYESELIGYIVIKNKVFRIILEKIGNKKYNIKTYYSTLKYTNFLNRAYIKQGYLYIKGEKFSKIYDGLYGKIVCDYNLPLKLPEMEDFKPVGDGKSPLEKVDDFVNVKLADNLIGKRETNTMPQWGGSCWYYLRYMDNLNDKEIVNKDISNYWGEVDLYVGGIEHAVLHLLYARFWHKFLFDIGVTPTDEPFQKLRNQGLILSYSYQNSKGKLIANDLVEEKKGQFYDRETKEELKKIIAKMSKSLKNVVNPDEIVEKYGADSLRLYEMYMADFKDPAPWDTKNILGVRRFLEKSERLFTTEAKISIKDDNFSLKLLNKTIKKVGSDIENCKFNTAISGLMILVNNGVPEDIKLQKEWKNIFLRLLHPFAPHLAEELWEKVGEKTSIFFSSWPKYDEKMIVDDTITIGVQVLGKVRGEIEINKDEIKENVIKKAKEDSKISKWIEGKTIIKEIYVPGRIVNIVVR